MATREYRSSVRARHAEDTRRTIIDAATALFAEQGYARTSVAAVAAAAGGALNTGDTSGGGQAGLVMALTEVYRGVGGKGALIRALPGGGPDAPTAGKPVRGMEEPTARGGVLPPPAEGTGRVRREREGVLGILLDNRTADPDVAAAADA